MHVDDADYTFLVFCNPAWDLMWGGKTMFVQDDGRFDAVFPKPGSASVSYTHLTLPTTPYV